jgi:hypothetical protein
VLSSDAEGAALGTLDDALGNMAGAPVQPAVRKAITSIMQANLLFTMNFPSLLSDYTAIRAWLQSPVYEFTIF